MGNIARALLAGPVLVLWLLIAGYALYFASIEAGCAMNETVACAEFDTFWLTDQG